MCLHAPPCPAPQRNFEIAFKMFDLNGDGEVDLEEFEQVRLLTAEEIGKRSNTQQKLSNLNCKTLTWNRVGTDLQ